MNTPNLPTYNPPAGRPALQPGDAVRFTERTPAPSGDIEAGAVGIVLAAQLGGAAGTPGYLLIVSFSDGRDAVLAHEARVELDPHGVQTRRSGEGREHSVPCQSCGLAAGVMTWNNSGRCNLHTVQREVAGVALDPRTEAEARMWGRSFGGESF